MHLHHPMTNKKDNRGHSSWERSDFLMMKSSFQKSKKTNSRFNFSYISATVYPNLSLYPTIVNLMMKLSFQKSKKTNSKFNLVTYRLYPNLSLYPTIVTINFLYYFYGKIVLNHHLAMSI